MYSILKMDFDLNIISRELNQINNRLKKNFAYIVDVPHERNICLYELYRVSKLSRGTLCNPSNPSFLLFFS